jgi:secondary thiamine-phosphate synthase enzyme
MVIQAKTIQVITTKQVEIFDLTQEVESFVAESGVRNGIGVVSTLHTTTGVFFTETQDALWGDVDTFLRTLVAERVGYKHNDPRFSDCDRQNAAAHLRAIVLGGSLALQVEEGRVVLGQFQRIIFAELDGPRPRSVRMQFMGEEAHPVTGLHIWNDEGSLELPRNGGVG